jgi:hypothetical protein
MSYAICRVQKIKGASAVHGVQVHQRRERESNTNPDIDYSRRNLNYSLIDESRKSFNTLADERIAQGYTGKKAIRKDAVKVVSALFTSDNDFFQGKSPYEQRGFFEDCYKWACVRFGRDNIFSAVVHMDEATPHLHIEFVPLTADGRLSAFDVLGGRVQLQRMQDDFWKKVGKPHGLERGERADFDDPNAKKPRKHLETVELKQKTAAELKDLEAQKENIAAECTVMHAECVKLKEDCKTLMEDKNALEGEIYALQSKVGKLESTLDDKNAEYDVTLKQLKDILNKKARASEIRSFNLFEKKETQTYHINMLESTRSIGDKAYRDLLKAKEKLVEIEKTKKQIEKMSQEVKPLHEQATAELQRAQQLRQSQELHIQRQAQALFDKKSKEVFGKFSDSRTKRLEKFCEGVHFDNGRNVFDVFNEKEQLLEKQTQSYTASFSRGRSR